MSNNVSLEQDNQEQNLEETNLETETNQTLEQALAEAASLKTRLSEVNRESASRRKEIQALQQQLSELTNKDKSQEERDAQERKSLIDRLNETQQRLLTYELRDMFDVQAIKAKVTWSSDQAARDAFQLATPQLLALSEDDRTDEAVGKVLQSVIKNRPYLTGKAQAPEIDGRKKGELPEVTADDIASQKAKSGQYTSF